MYRPFLFFVLIISLGTVNTIASEIDLTPKGNGNGTGEGNFVVRVTYENEISKYYDLYSAEIDEQSQYVAALKFVKNLHAGDKITHWCVVGTEDCF